MANIRARAAYYFFTWITTRAKTYASRKAVVRGSLLTGMMLCFGPSALAASSSPLSAPLAPTPPPANADTSPKAIRRSGLVIGGTGLFASGTAAGYPNQSSLIGDPTYYGAGGVMAGGGGEGFIMAALADVFDFGLFISYTLVANNDWSSEGIGGGFRLETFPFFSIVPVLRDLGFFAQFGIGSANLDASHGAYPGATGVQSFISVGIFHEWTLGRLKHGRFTIAPSLEYDYIGSQSINRHVAGLGLRVAFYSGP